MSRTKRNKWAPQEKRQKSYENAVAKGHIDQSDPRYQQHLGPAVTTAVTSKSKPRAFRRQHSQAKPVYSSPSSTTGLTTSSAKPVQQNQRPKIPFGPEDHVLLVGEGDFSFTESLVRNYRVRNVVSTCFDSRVEVVGKYEGFRGRLVRLGVEVPDADSDEDKKKGGGEDVWNGFEGDGGKDNAVGAAAELDPTETSTASPSELQTKDITVLHGLDATKLHTTHKKALRPHAPFSKIVFNFPHVGGRSTDVNRQVRSNQQLLVGFFESAKKLLATKENPLKARPSPQRQQRRIQNSDDNDNDDTDYEFDLDPDLDPNSDSDLTSSAPQSQILLTLFEGEPYTLWNPRDLARHSGLRVVESFRFPWSAYPGYEHARTIGDVATGKDRSEEGKRKGRWRGEERLARCFVLEVRDGDGDGDVGGGGGGRTRKRGREGGESDDTD